MSDTCRNCRRPIMWGVPADGGRANWFHTTASLGSARTCIGIDWPYGAPWPVAEPSSADNSAPEPDASTAHGRLWSALSDQLTPDAKDQLIADYREELTTQLAEQIIADAEGVHGGAADGRHAAAELIDPRSSSE